MRLGVAISSSPALWPGPPSTCIYLCAEALNPHRVEARQGAFNTLCWLVQAWLPKPVPSLHLPQKSPLAGVQVGGPGPDSSIFLLFLLAFRV